MSKDELLARLAAALNEDEKEAHIEADAALIDYINDEDIRAAYEAIPKWYA